MILPDNFRDVVVALSDAGARFVVLGGFAVAYHGHVRATKDIDLFVEATEANAARVERALAEFGAPLTRDALLRNKRAVGRLQDLADVEALERETE
jgi:aminoglycoside-2''-adenylyltransferase